MPEKEERRQRNERLDRLGREVLRAASASDERLAERASSAPFLYTRVRARIAEERERREEMQGWQIFSVLMRRAIVMMTLVATLSLGVFLFARVRTQTARAFSDEAFFGASRVGVERILFQERAPLSNDEVLATIMTDEREVPR
ncbi:MAG TPA: hypothetical protein VF544_22995 [Pyrinomonadaceae bacterium]|jgi:hypothetical protein